MSLASKSSLQATNGGPTIDWGDALARHGRWLRTAVAARVREPEGVDEVMQSVAVAAVEQRAPLADASKLAPWLYRLAVWQSLLYLRRLGRERRAAGSYARALLANGQHHAAPDPLAWLLREERHDLIRAALGRLSGQDAEILLLKYTENWSYQDLADHLGIGLRAVESRLHRARAKLRRQLSEFERRG